MTFNNAKFITSAPNKKFWPKETLVEIAFLGRSNVGKSSFINSICKNGKLARVSNTPGRTQLLNFFNVDEKFIIVDTPGFGFAKVAAVVRKQFALMMEQYINERSTTAGFVLIIDSRHGPTSDDMFVYNLLIRRSLPVLIVATKVDKLNQSEQYAFKKRLNESLPNINYIVTDNRSSKYIDNAISSIENMFLK